MFSSCLSSTSILIPAHGIAQLEIPYYESFCGQHWDCCPQKLFYTGGRHRQEQPDGSGGAASRLSNGPRPYGSGLLPSQPTSGPSPLNWAGCWWCRKLGPRAEVHAGPGGSSRPGTHPSSTARDSGAAREQRPGAGPSLHRPSPPELHRDSEGGGLRNKYL